MVVTFDIHYYFKLQTWASFKRRKGEGLVLLISGIVRACQKSQCGWGVVVFPENNYVLEHLWHSSSILLASYYPIALHTHTHTHTQVVLLCPWWL